LAASPRHGSPRETLPAIPGHVPEPGAWPFGCHFAPRCALATEACSAAPIPVVEAGPHHQTRCIHHEETRQGGDRERAALGHQ
jgi:peptide/nickel transport system permease protein